MPEFYLESPMQRNDSLKPYEAQDDRLNGFAVFDILIKEHEMSLTIIL